VSDITYIRLGQGFVHLAVIMDVFTRSVRGWNLSKFLDHSLPLGALNLALEKGVPAIHHSDQGVQYAAEEYVGLLLRNGVRISMAAMGRPDENGCAKRVVRTIIEGGGACRARGLRLRQSPDRRVHRGGVPKKADPFSAGVFNAG